MNNDSISRRKVALTISSAVVGSIAGCLNSNSNDNNDDDNDNNSKSDSKSNNPKEILDTSPVKYPQYSDWLGGDIKKEYKNITRSKYSIVNKDEFSYVVKDSEINEDLVDTKVQSIMEVIPLKALSNFTFGKTIWNYPTLAKYIQGKNEEKTERHVGKKESVTTIGGEFSFHRFRGDTTHFTLDNFDTEKLLQENSVKKKKEIGEYIYCESNKIFNENTENGNPFAISDSELIIGPNGANVDENQIVKDYVSKISKEESTTSNIVQLSKYCGDGLITVGANVDKNTELDTEYSITLGFGLGTWIEGVKDIDINTVEAYEPDIESFLFTLDTYNGKRVARSGFIFSEPKTAEELDGFVQSLSYNNIKRNTFIQDNMVIVEAFFDY